MVWAHATSWSLLVFILKIIAFPLGFIIFIIALISFNKWRGKKKLQKNSESDQNIDSSTYQESALDSQEMVFCGQCDAKNKTTQNYCVKCGAELTHELL